MSREQTFEEWLDTVDDLDSAPVVGEPVRHKDWLDHSAQYKCPKCNGTGRVTFGYVNVRTGKCFKCNGKGGFKTSPEQRQKARQSARDRKAREQLANAQSAADALESREGSREWFEKIISNNKAYESGTFHAFVYDLWQKLHKYGDLSPKQWGVIERGMERDQEWQAKRAEENSAAVSDVDLRSLPVGNRGVSMFAVPGGDTRLKVMVKTVTRGKWSGYIFVSDGAAYGHRKNYGRQAPGANYSGEIVDQLRAIVADPKGAAVAYGRLVGRCARCSRPLEDSDSVAAGIGPICAGKWGM